MCDTCGCGDPEIVPLDVQDDILSGNAGAGHNRDRFRQHGLFTINLMGSPGAGKTAVLEATAQRLGEHGRCGALAGDLATDRDAARLTRAGDYLFIEKVGNLVCPAVYDLGQDVNVVALSITEGEDKPVKYP